MALPSKSNIESLDYVEWSLPAVFVDAKAAVNSYSLDIVEWSLPVACAPGGAASTPSDPTNVIYIKTGASTWSQASNIYIKTGSTTWQEISALSIKTGSSEWNT